MSDAPGVSLGKLGLRIARGVECPAGGTHQVPAGRLVVIAAQGGGTAACVKCQRIISIEQA